MPLVLVIAMSAYFFLRGFSSIPQSLPNDAGSENAATKAKTSIVSHFRTNDNASANVSAREIPSKFSIPATQHIDSAKLDPQKKEILDQILQKQAHGKTNGTVDEASQTSATGTVEVKVMEPLPYRISDDLYAKLSPQEQNALDIAEKDFEKRLSEYGALDPNSEDYFWAWVDSDRAVDEGLRAYLGWKRYMELSWAAKN